jgi:hypothetical protein
MVLAADRVWSVVIGGFRDVIVMDNGRMAWLIYLSCVCRVQSTGVALATLSRDLESLIFFRPEATTAE